MQINWMLLLPQNLQFVSHAVLGGLVTSFSFQHARVVVLIAVISPSLNFQHML